MIRVRALALGLFLAMACGAPAARADEPCLSASPPAVSARPIPIRFGIAPQLAGTAGAAQAEVAPEDPRARDRALDALRPPRRELVISLNRLFMSDGDAGIARFARRARHFARRGFAVESQIRYHPPSGLEGEISAWRRFVRRATRALAANRSLVALSITNEVNLPISANTSDGAFPRAAEALIGGVSAAGRVLHRLGRDDVALGFTYAYRYLPTADAAFWQRINALSTPRFRHHLDYVGVQLYPGLFWPPALITQTAGEATAEGLTIVRDCYMPMAGLGPRFAIWITEIGYATNLGHDEARQASELRETVRVVDGIAARLGVTDLRYFNLRDNRAQGSDLFDDVGLLRADYTAKPSFGVYRSLIREYGR